MCKSKKIFNVIIFMIILAIIPITICFKLFGSNIPEDFIPIFLGKVVVYGIIFIVTFVMILLIAREGKENNNSE